MQAAATQQAVPHEPPVPRLVHLPLSPPPLEVHLLVEFLFQFPALLATARSRPRSPLNSFRCPLPLDQGRQRRSLQPAVPVRSVQLVPAPRAWGRAETADHTGRQRVQPCSPQYSVCLRQADRPPRRLA